MTAPLRVAVVGGGPRATYALERLAAHAAALTESRPLEVHVFERTGQFGAGSVHDPRQSTTAVLNRTADEVAFCADESVVGAGPLRPADARPTLAGWMAAHGGPSDAGSVWPPRAVHGEALVDHLRTFVDELERTGRARVHLHATEVVDLRGCAVGEVAVVDRRGRSWPVDDVLLVTGHGSPRPAHAPGTPCPDDRADDRTDDRADARARVHLTTPYPLDDPSSVALVPAGARVACVGTGMTAIDVVMALTTGRGGRFTARADGRLDYVPSGAEPSVIHCSSRSGTFPYARPAALATVSPFVDERGGRFLRLDVLDRLRRSRAGHRTGGRGRRDVLDFDLDVLPLVVVEMAHQHHAALLGRAAADAAADAVAPAVDAFVDGRPSAGPVRPDVLSRLLASHVAVDEPFDWEALLDPYAGARTGAEVADVLDLDVARARQGVGVSPHKTATNGVWRDLRGVVSAAVDDGGLTAASHRRFVDRVASWHNRFANGASPDVMARVAALVRCGLVQVGRSAPDERRPACAAPRPAVDALGGEPDVLVDAWVPRLDVRTDLNPLYRRLVERGAMTLWQTGNGPDAFLPGGVRVDDRHHPVRADGTTDPRLTVLGPVLEGQRSFLVSALRPRRDHPVMRDAVAWLDDLRARHATHPDQQHRPSTTERTPTMGTATTRRAVGAHGDTHGDAHGDAHGEIGLLVDEPTTDEHLGDVVVAPVFGGTARSMFPFAHALNQHGFRTVRVDFRHHVGTGSGDIAGTRLSAQAEDVEAALEVYPGALLVAVSLATRPAVRALSRGADARGVVLVTPVLDVTATLREVIGADYLDVDFASTPPQLDVLGYDVRDSFVHDARAHRLHEVDVAVAELAGSDVPVRLVAGDTDPWVDVVVVRDAAARLADDGRDVRLVEVAAATHRLNRNPVVARRYVEETVRACLDLVGSDRPVDVPSFDALVRASSRRPTPAGVPG